MDAISLNRWNEGNIEDAHRQIRRELKNGIDKIRLFEHFYHNGGCNGMMYTNGIIYNLSNYFLKRIEYSLEEVAGEHYSRFVHPDDRDVATKVQKEWADNGGNFPSFQNRWMSKSGKEILLLWESIGMALEHDEKTLHLIKAVEVSPNFCSPMFCHFKRES